MKDVVLITGANGHLAKFVSKFLSKDYIVKHLTTRKVLSSKDSYFYWDIKKKYIDPKAFEDCKHIIHLAGYPILKRWTKKNKQTMYDSRVKSTRLIFETMRKINITPKTFISASAIGIYEKSLTGNVHEDSLKGKDWLAKMACDWEDASNRFKAIGTRVVQLRISLIFSDLGGFLKYNLLSMKFGIGAIVGDPNRKVHWIHVKDISRFIKQSLINNNYNGPYNLASDDKKSQLEFIKAIKKYLFSNSIIIKIPIFLLKIFLGERTQIIDSDLSIDTKKIKQNGFQCEINNLEKILQNLK